MCCWSGWGWEGWGGWVMDVGEGMCYGEKKKLKKIFKVAESKKIKCVWTDEWVNKL